MGEIKLGWNVSSVKTIINILITFSLTCFAWIFFRADTLYDAIHYIQRIFYFDFRINKIREYVDYSLVFLLLYFIYQEWKYRNCYFPLEKTTRLKLVFIICLIILFGQFGVKNEFIYFQF